MKKTKRLTSFLVALTMVISLFSTAFADGTVTVTYNKGVTYHIGDVALLTANVTDITNIANVEFYDGTTLLGNVTVAPYTFNYINLPLGDRSITAKVTDSNTVYTSETAVLSVLPTTPQKVQVAGTDFTSYTGKNNGLTGTNVSITSDAASGSYQAKATSTLTAPDRAGDKGLKLDTPITATSTEAYRIYLNIYDKMNVENTDIEISMDMNFTDFNAGTTFVKLYGASDATGTSNNQSFVPIVFNTDGTITYKNASNTSLKLKKYANTGADDYLLETGKWYNFKYITWTNGTNRQWEFYIDGELALPTMAQWSGAKPPASNNYMYYIRSGGYVFGGGSTSTTATRTMYVDNIFAYQYFPATVTTTSISTPTTGVMIESGASVDFTAQASTSDTSTIQKVQYYQNGQMIGEATTSPYTVSTTFPSGTYSVTARAISTTGYSGYSSAISLTVDDSTATPTPTSTTEPTATPTTTPNTVETVTVSVDNAGTLIQGDTVLLTANTTNISDIKKVEFYDGATLLKTVTASPYQYYYTNLPVGNKSITAKVTDGADNIYTSDPIALSIQTAPLKKLQLTGTDFTGYAGGNTMPTGSSLSLSPYNLANSNRAINQLNPPNRAGNNCIEFDTTLTSGEGYRLYMGTSAFTDSLYKVEANFDICFADFNTGHELIKFKGVDPTTGATNSTTFVPISVALGGQLQYKPAGSNTTTNVLNSSSENYILATNTWYAVRFTTYINNGYRMYEVSIDGTTVVGPITMWSGSTGQNLYQISGEFFTAGSANTTATGTTYIDNVATYQYKPSSAATSITAPLNNSVCYAGTPVTLTASASCAESTISKVQYFCDGQLLGEATTSPYTVNVTLSKGIYSVTSRAITASGDNAYSSPITFNVSALKLPTTFGSNMIFQRNQPIKINGNGTTGDTITITFAGQTQTAEVVGGNWETSFPSISTPGGSYTLNVSDSEGTTITLTNITIGDVWVVSGQSNMAFTMDWFGLYADEATANYPNIRLFLQDNQGTDLPASDVLNGNWNVCTPTTVKNFSAVGYMFGKQLFNDMNQQVPVGLLYSAVGGTQMSSWIRQNVKNDPDLLRYYQENSITTTTDIKRRSALYYGMVSPLQNQKIAGVVWYQGEGDTFESIPYGKTLETLIKTWREDWKQGDFPFVVTQIPNYDYKLISPTGRSASFVREAQMQASVNLPNVGTAVTIDVGNDNNIHPTNKATVGQRLALQAEKLTMNNGTTIYNSPTYKSMSIVGNSIDITFNDVGTGLTTTDANAPLSFTICGEDKVFVAATAQIINSNTISVSAPSVSNPVAVRYAWSDIPNVNLVNSDNLPVSPFRTDKWQVTSVNQAPTIKVTSPQNNSAFPPFSRIDIHVSANDLDGDITKVEFYDGNTKLGEDTTAPYQYVWINVQAGLHNIKVIATDDSGNSSVTANSYTASDEPTTITAGNASLSDSTIVDMNFANYNYSEAGTTSPSGMPSGTAIDRKLGLVYGAYLPDRPTLKLMKQYIAASGEGPITTAYITPITTGTLVAETNIQFDSISSGNMIAGIKANGLNTYFSPLTFSSDGTVKFSNVTTRTLMQYQPNVWYNVKIMYNLDLDTCTVFINGQKLIDNEKIPFINSIESITFKHNFVVGGDLSCSMYFEYIKYSIETSTGTATPGLYVNILPFTNTSEQNITNFAGQTGVNTNISLKNTLGVDKKANVTIVGYDTNGTVSFVRIVKPNTNGIILAETSVDLQELIDISLYPNVQYMKAFVFEDYDSIKPLTSSEYSRINK